MNSEKRRVSPTVRISLKGSGSPTSPASESFAFAFQIRKPSTRQSLKASPAVSPRKVSLIETVRKRPEEIISPRAVEEAKFRSRLDLKTKKATSHSPPPPGPKGAATQRPSTQATERRLGEQHGREGSLAQLLVHLANEEHKIVASVEKEHKRNSSLDHDSDQLNNSDEKTVRRGFHARASSFSDLSSSKDLPKPPSLNPEAEEEEKERLIQVIRMSYRVKGEPPASSSEFYRYGKMLGKGAFGKVSLAIHRLTGLNVAIKSIEKAYMKDERARKKIFQEVFTMRRVHHPNVTRLYEVFESSRHFNMVLEYSGGGDLLQFVKTRSKLTESESAQILNQLLSGLQACHDKNIIHRDVKLDNVLIDASYASVKLCDFGVSRMVTPGQRIAEQCGTPAYIAPEIIADRGYEGFPVDVWSLGVLLYAMLTGTVPFRAKTMSELHKLILKGRFDIPDCVSDSAAELLRGMMTLVPSHRLSLAEVAAHPWTQSCHSEQSVFDSTVPRFLGGGGETPEKVASDVILRRMEGLGFPKQSVVSSLRNREINHATATYELLEGQLSNSC